MTKGKLDKILNGGMKAKLILIGICVVLLIVMILVLCLTGGQETTSQTEGSGSFVSETSDVQPETVAADAAVSSVEGGAVGSGEEGDVNQQESGEAAQASEAPAALEPQPDAEEPPENDEQQTPADVTVPDPAPTAQPSPVPSAGQPTPSPTAVPQEPQPDANAPKPDMTIVVEQQDDVMEVTTGYCVVEYPFAFSEVIQVALKETETGASLEFTASIRGQTAPLYTLWLNTEKGVPYGTVTVGGYTSKVNVETYDPTGLTEENKVTFNAAQETINDVLQSLQNRNTFTPAE